VPQLTAAEKLARRTILNALIARRPLDELPYTDAAVSWHLIWLRHAGLAAVTAHGWHATGAARTSPARLDLAA
jgi:hypothetical protein